MDYSDYRDLIAEKEQLKQKYDELKHKYSSLLNENYEEVVSLQNENEHLKYKVKMLEHRIQGLKELLKYVDKDTEKTLHSLSEEIIKLSLKVAYAEEKGINFDKDYEEYIGISEHDV